MVTLFNMETKTKVNLWSLMATVKTLRQEFWEIITALDLCQEHLSWCQEKNSSALVFVSLYVARIMLLSCQAFHWRLLWSPIPSSHLFKRLTHQIFQRLSFEIRLCVILFQVRHGNRKLRRRLDKMESVYIEINSTVHCLIKSIALSLGEQMQKQLGGLK